MTCIAQYFKTTVLMWLLQALVNIWKLQKLYLNCLLIFFLFSFNDFLKLYNTIILYIYFKDTFSGVIIWGMILIFVYQLCKHLKIYIEAFFPNFQIWNNFIIHSTNNNHGNKVFPLTLTSLEKSFNNKMFHHGVLFLYVLTWYL